MKVTKLMGLAVILVALAAAMNALAFKTAVIKNPVNITVNTTQTASVSFDTPSVSPSAGASASFTGGYMTISITEHPQPNSEYTWLNVFKMAKESGVTLNGLTAALTNDSGVAFTDVSVTLVKSDGSTLAFGDVTNSGLDVGIKLTLGPTAATGALTNAQLRITATQAN